MSAQKYIKHKFMFFISMNTEATSNNVKLSTLARTTWHGTGRAVCTNHAEEDGERVALIWEKDRPGEHKAVTYRYVWVRVPVHIIACVCVSIYVCGVHVLIHSGVVLNLANDCTS